jgi:hypothetical protein
LPRPQPAVEHPQPRETCRREQRAFIKDTPGVVPVSHDQERPGSQEGSQPQFAKRQI